MDDIIDNKLYFSGLTENIYRYRVRANKDGAKSGWSKYQEVDMQEDTNVDNLLNNENTLDNRMFDLKGARMDTPSHSGIYIIRKHRKTSKKFLIK